MDDKKGITILVVEDDDSTRKSFALFLMSKKYKVFEAENGQIGLERFREKKPDLLLLDLRMPVLNGLEVLAEVKKESPDMPVIVISGTEKISETVEALHLGAWDYVLKPVQDMSVLYHSVEKVLERVRLIRESKQYHQRLEADIEERTKELKLTNQNLIREISERQRVEEALRESERTYRAIFNAATAALFIIADDGQIIEANAPACSTYNYSLEELSQQTIQDLVLPENLKKLEGFLENARSESNEQAELVLLKKDGSKIVNEVVATEVDYKGNKHILLVFRDITERKRAEEQERLHHQQLIQADKMASLGILVSEVAHEINNPNNFIMVNAPILKKIWKTMEPILEDYFQANGDFYLAPRVRYSEMKEQVPAIISGIQEGSQRINNFVGELKNFARPTPSIMEKGIDLNKVIHSGVALLANLIKKTTERFSISYGENIPKIKGNFQQLEQVVVNLIENSCQALPGRDKALFVSTQYDPSLHMVKIQIRDEGHGMTQETISKIKDPFFTTKRAEGGTGLGLSISSRIIEWHGGSMEFESVPGLGTTAAILLPVEGE